MFYKFQTHVSHRSSEFLGSFAANSASGPICRTFGCGTTWFAAIPLRLPSQLVAGGRKGGSAATLPHLRPSGLSSESGGTAKTGRLLRKGEVDKQRDGQERTGESKRLNLWSSDFKKPEQSQNRVIVRMDRYVLTVFKILTNNPQALVS